jgi:hypothetical protein
MARNSAPALKLVVSHSRGKSPLTERLNNQVLDTIRELAKGVEEDPGVEDEYEFEIFGNTGPASPKKKTK